LALCSDGTVAAWGDGSYGQLGNNSFLQPNAPVAVSTASNSALFGKTVVEVEAGAEYCTALCSDGSLVSWGENYDGQLGDSTTIRRYVPVLVSTGTNSALYGRAVTAMAPGGRHNLILCSDGTICTCGNNSYGQLGNATSTNRSTTGSVDIGTNSALFGKVVVGIAGGGDHSLALCSDGTLAAWGWNLFGQLGDNTGTNRFVPTAVDISSIGTGSRFIGIFRGEAATYNSFALVALPVP
jgi:alpha-tubulin suppressor-like RCC1 family protein